MNDVDIWDFKSCNACLFQNKPVEGNDIYVADIQRKRRYRYSMIILCTFCKVLPPFSRANLSVVFSEISRSKKENLPSGGF